MSPDELAARLRRWVEQEPALPGPLDAASLAFCRRKLRQLAEPGLLRRKLEREVIGSWEPLGRVLLVISEQDVLGTVTSAVAACATGNALRIKSRFTRPLLEALCRALELGPDECDLRDWDSRDHDDGELLEGIDAVLLTGSEALIRHYRSITPAGVRLVEYGPKIGVAAVGGEVEDLSTLAGSLASDVTLFGQSVGSSPQLIFVEDDGVARALRKRLLDMKLPPLSGAERLNQLVRLKELALHARLGDEIVVDVAPQSGWGITISRDPAHRLPKGFAFVVGPLPEQLGAFARANRRYLQTLGTWGPVPNLGAFTHRCRIGRMHDRPPLAPHDGIFELASLVRLTSHGHEV